MRSYFHCATARFGRRAASAVTVIAAACAGAAFTAFIVTYFGILTSRGTLSPGPLAAAAAVIAGGLALCLKLKLSADKKTAMHSRYTFLDIQLRFAALSIYSGEIRRRGEKVVIRELYLIPFDSFVSAAPSRSGRKILLRGRMRHYVMDSRDLGYHIRDGSAEFDRWWLNHGAFTEIDGAEIPVLFGSPRRVCTALKKAKERFDALPKPKPREPAKPGVMRSAPRRRPPERLHYDPYRNRYVK